MKKFFKTLKIVQEKKNKTARLNPYNPLTYLLILVIFIVGLFLYGFIGFFEKVDFYELRFKYR